MKENTNRFIYRADDEYIYRMTRLDGRKDLEVGVKHFIADRDLHDLESVFDYCFLRSERYHRLPQIRDGLSAVDLFCGCGGLSLGAREACRAFGLDFLENVLYGEEAKKNLKELGFSQDNCLTFGGKCPWSAKEN